MKKVKQTVTAYSIAYLEQLSGVKAHTLRIWEQRYGLLKPLRTQTNIRYYNDDQLRQLLNITLLLEHGHRIGEIADMGLKQIHKRVLEISEDRAGDDLQKKAIIHQLVISAMAYEEALFGKTYAQAVMRYGPYETYTDIIVPLMERIGVLWGTGEVIPASEHFLSNLIRQKIIHATESLATSQTGPVWILFLPEYEEHELGLLVAAFMLKSAGYRVIYLGQRVPDTNVQMLVKTLRPQGVLWFVVKHTPPSKVQQQLSSLQKMFPQLTQLLCTSAKQARNLRKGKETHILQSPHELASWIKDQKKNRSRA